MLSLYLCPLFALTAACTVSVISFTNLQNMRVYIILTTHLEHPIWCHVMAYVYLYEEVQSDCGIFTADERQCKSSHT